MTRQAQPQAAQMMDRRMNDDTIDLLELAEYLWKRIFAIISATLTGGIAAFVITMLFITPLYSSSVMVYVNNSSVSLGGGSVNIDTGSLTASRSLVDTYIVILNSRETLEEIIDEDGLDYDYIELGKMITSEAVNETEVFRITVTGPDPQEASDIANTILKVLPARIKTIVDGSNAVRVDSAIPAVKPDSPNVLKNTALGALIGLALACGVFVVIFLTDIEIHSENYLLNTYPDIPLLTVVPDVNASSHAYGYGYYRRPAPKITESEKVS